jgi:hypothetical protein
MIIIASTVFAIILLMFIWNNFIYGEVTNKDMADIKVITKDTTYFWQNVPRKHFFYNFRHPKLRFVEIKESGRTRRFMEPKGILIDYKKKELGSIEFK